MGGGRDLTEASSSGSYPLVLGSEAQPRVSPSLCLGFSRQRLKKPYWKLGLYLVRGWLSPSIEMTLDRLYTNFYIAIFHLLLRCHYLSDFLVSHQLPSRQPQGSRGWKLEKGVSTTHQ